MASHSYSSYNNGPYVSGDATAASQASNRGPVLPTTKYGRFDREEELVEEGLGFLTCAVPITVPDEIAEQCKFMCDYMSCVRECLPLNTVRAGEMAPILVYNEQRETLQIGVKPGEGVNVEVRSTLLSVTLK